MKWKKAFEANIPEWAVPGNLVIELSTGFEMTIYGVAREEVNAGSKNAAVRWFAFSELKPIEQWTPQIGEMVACWDAGPDVAFYTYTGAENDEHTANGYTWSHMYRIPAEWKNIPEQNTPEWFAANSERLV